VTDPLIKAALQDKLVAFVGTIGERDGDGLSPPLHVHLATLISPYSVFFSIPASADPYVGAWPITSAQLWRPNDHSPMPDGWISVGSPFDQSFITPNLLPAGGLSDAIYAFMRGNEGDMTSLPRKDGVPYYARDTKSLWLFDRVQGRWIKVAQHDIVPVGGMIAWPEALDAFNPLPEAYIRADGTLRLQSAYPELYAVVKDAYENPLDPTPLGQFRLPLYSGMIVRYRE
jgi:hypothetical protein